MYKYKVERIRGRRTVHRHGVADSPVFADNSHPIYVADYPNMKTAELAAWDQQKARYRESDAPERKQSVQFLQSSLSDSDSVSVCRLAAVARRCAATLS